MRPPGWKVVRATGGVVFLECQNTRFVLLPHEDEVKRLACLLTRKDREIDRLKRRIYEMEMRS